MKNLSNKQTKTLLQILESVPCFLGKMAPDTSQVLQDLSYYVEFREIDYYVLHFGGAKIKNH